MQARPIERFALKSSDKQSDAWRHLKKELEKRLADERSRNDSNQLDERNTAYLRGRIAVLKELIALDTQNPPPE